MEFNLTVVSYLNWNHQPAMQDFQYKNISSRAIFLLCLIALMQNVKLHDYYGKFLITLKQLILSQKKE